MINTIFFSSSIYSVIILKKLIKLPDFSLTAIVTKPDKPTGRHQAITANPVSQFATKHQIPLLQPTSFNPSFIKQLRSLHPHLILVVAYGPPFFTANIINIPQYKIVNIHPSPLPQYRGATPGPWQIINNEKQSAVTFFQIDSQPDHGPIIRQIPFSISPTTTTESFYHQAFRLAADKLDTTLSEYINNPNKLLHQDHSKKTYFPKFTKNEAQINWNWSTVKIERFVRALIPWPIAWTYVKNQAGQKLKMKIFSAQLKDKQLIPLSVQIEGKTKTDWSQIKNHYTIIFSSSH